MKNIWGVISDIILGIAILSAAAFLGFVFGYGEGQERGYTDALDDIRLGKPARYKLVQTAEKWVEVRSD